jgi:hypothetical protein
MAFSHSPKLFSCWFSFVGLKTDEKWAVLNQVSHEKRRHDNQSISEEPLRIEVEER